MSKKAKKAEDEFLLSPVNNPMLNYGVYIAKPIEKIIFTIVTVIGGGVVSLLFFGGLFKDDGQATVVTYISNTVVFLVVGFIVAKVLYPTYISSRKGKRDALLSKQFRDLLEALSASFSTGSNANEAFMSAYADMAQQYGEESFIAVEVNEIISGVRQNISIATMLNSFAVRTGNEDIINFANVYQVAIDKGADLKAVIRRTHSILSNKMAVSEEIQTKLASNKMQHMVMSVMPIGIVAMLRFTNDQFADSFASPLGILVNIIAILIFVGSFVVGQKICDVK